MHIYTESAKVSQNSYLYPPNYTTEVSTLEAISLTIACKQTVDTMHLL